MYDRVNKWGGAERVIIALRKIFPDSVLFTSVYEQKRASWAKKIPIVSSFLQKIPFVPQFHEGFALFMPIAFESFNFDEYDLVISLTSEAAKGIITKPGTRHISIILTPTRYLWSGYRDYFSNPVLKFASWPFVVYLRFWDKIAANRPDKLIAISTTVQKRIKKYYGLESEIIYPPLMIRSSVSSIRYPVSSKRSTQYSIQNTEYFLVVSRLVPYKRIDIAIRAANKARVPLKIIGSGSAGVKLLKMAGPTVEFLGQVSDSDLKYYYSNCRALVFPGVEDFGLTIVEAQAFGKPVIAFRGGGAEEIIVEGKTGVFFDKQNSTALGAVLAKFKASRYNSKDCIKNSKRFSYEQFKQRILEIINNK